MALANMANMKFAEIIRGAASQRTQVPTQPSESPRVVKLGREGVLDRMTNLIVECNNAVVQLQGERARLDRLYEQQAAELTEETEKATEALDEARRAFDAEIASRGIRGLVRPVAVETTRSVPVPTVKLERPEE